MNKFRNQICYWKLTGRLGFIFFACLIASKTLAQQIVFCLQDPVVGTPYSWNIWLNTPPYVSISGNVVMPGSAPSGNTVGFRDDLINSMNTNLPVGWSASIAFTDDHCPGWDTALDINTPNGEGFYLSFNLEYTGLSCTAHGGFCQPDPKIRRYKANEVVVGLGTPDSAQLTFCLNGAATGASWSWMIPFGPLGGPSTYSSPFGTYMTVPPSGNTVDIRNVQVDAINATFSNGDSQIYGKSPAALNAAAVSGYEFTDLVCPGWDTAFTLTGPNDALRPLNLAISSGGTAVTINVIGAPPSPGVLTFNPDITLAAGTYFPYSFEYEIFNVPALPLVGLFALSVTLAATYRWQKSSHRIKADN